MTPTIRSELLKLIEAVLEGTASAEKIARIEKLVQEDADCLKLYVQMMQLHGNLYWDAAGRGAEFEIPDRQPVVKSTRSQQKTAMASPRQQKIAGLVTTLAILGVAVWLVRGVSDPSVDPTATKNLAANNVNSNNSTGSNTNSEANEIVNVTLPRDSRNEDEDLRPIIPELTPSSRDDLPFNAFVDTQIVSFINNQIEEGWQTNNVQPSPQADDAEWVRRVYLDLAGRIPTLAESKAFLNDVSPQKRQRLVTSLVAGPEFAGNFASLWTTLLVGRTQERPIDRHELFSYLEDQFANNRPWSNTVADLISAQGSAEDSGPANFLLAHLNNQAVPATAITTRIFLCQQLQCSQCHTHPDVSAWGQEKFWEFNAFFQNTKIDQDMMTNDSGRQKRVPRLVEQVTQEKGLQPTYYEDLRGVMKVAYPQYGGVPVQDVGETSLRMQLAELMTKGDDTQLAVAFVNRCWKHFFGYAFTHNVDDMGPHHQVSHPGLIDALAKAFIANDYDVQKLIRWICRSDAYQLTSDELAQNKADAPDLGELPLFTRMYVKRLQPEQLYNSLLIVGGIAPSELIDDQNFYEHRDTWLQQFFKSAENEENSELSTFDASVPQTLLMMNGDLVSRAVDPQQGRVLQSILTDRNQSDVRRIQELCLAALSRYPTKTELEAIRKVIRQNIRLQTMENVPVEVAYRTAYRDVFWAYLNSSEFAVNH